MRAAIVMLLVVAGCATPLAAQEGGDGPRYAGRPLVDVLQDLNRRGLRIVFSTSLVPPALRVSAEPAGSPRDILDQVLRPHGLYARPGAQGLLIVARAPRRRDDAAPAIASRVVRGPVVDADRDQPAPTASVSGQVVAGANKAPVAGAAVEAGARPLRLAASADKANGHRRGRSLCD